MTHDAPIQMCVNGEEITETAAPLTTLASFLRKVGLKSVRLGCEEGVCGSCSVLLGGRSVRSCLTLAAQSQGASVQTVEGFTHDPKLRAMQDAFITHFAAQCGFCTGGMLVIVAEYLADRTVRDHIDEATIRERLNAVVCRCTGYQQIVAAVRSLALQNLFPNVS